ncbi:MAG: hypothetical protein WAN11_00390 [Syntrophobacteraceae bacterium]
MFPERICSLFSQQYPDLDLGNQKDPLDEYLYIVLSLRTHQKGLDCAFERLKSRFSSWQDAQEAGPEEIEKAIRPAGLSVQKSKNIAAALDLIGTEFGEISLNALKKIPAIQVEDFLLRLPGVGLKTAKCIMLFSLGFQVLPVDTHVAKIAIRIGWASKGWSSRKLHDALESIIPPHLRHQFHVYCIQHGRKVCRNTSPHCDQCCVRELCKANFAFSATAMG